jgi:hypothetical protein
MLERLKNMIVVVEIRDQTIVVFVPEGCGCNPEEL